MKRIEFSPSTKRKAYDRDKGICRACSLPVKTGQEEYDHILPAALGGKADLANCQLLCSPCHKEKTGKEDVPRIKKADRQRARHVGAKRPKGTIKSAGFPVKEKREGKLPIPKRTTDIYGRPL